MTFGRGGGLEREPKLGAQLGFVLDHEPCQRAHDAALADRFGFDVVGPQLA